MTLLLIQPIDKAHCWLTVNLGLTMMCRIHRAFSDNLLSSHAAPSLSSVIELFLTRGRACHFPLLNFMRLLSAHLSSLSLCFHIGRQPSWLYRFLTPPPQKNGEKIWWKKGLWVEIRSSLMEGREKKKGRAKAKGENNYFLISIS